MAGGGVTGCEFLGMVARFCHPVGQTISECRLLTRATLRSIACDRQQSPTFWL